MPSGPDALDELARLLGTSRRELVTAIIRESHKDWQRALKRELRKQRELQDLDEEE